MRTDRRKGTAGPPALGRLLTAAALLGLLTACGGAGDAATAGNEATAAGARAAGSPAPSGAPGAAASPRADSGQTASAPDPEPARPSGTRTIDITKMGYTEGSPDAPIRVVEFSDFGCHFCRKFHLETYPALHDQYIATGKVLWKYIPFVLGIFPHAKVAARAGECAISEDATRFPALRDRLFRDQKEWKDASDPLPVLVRLAGEAGLDGKEFRACLGTKEAAERVSRNTDLGHRVGVRGTPTFVVDGYSVSGAQPLTVFQQIFDAILNDPSHARSPTGGGRQ